MEKSYRLSEDQIRPLIRNYGGCIATDTITIDGFPVRFMYREDPDNEFDSGWRFLSGFESDDYMEDPENSGIFDVNTIANYDPSIIPLLDAPVGSVFEKTGQQERFVAVTDWHPDDDDDEED